MIRASNHRILWLPFSGMTEQVNSDRDAKVRQRSPTRKTPFYRNHSNYSFKKEA